MAVPDLRLWQVQDVVWVDLDKGTVVGDLYDAQALPNIPREAAESFLERCA